MRDWGATTSIPYSEACLFVPSKQDNPHLLSIGMQLEGKTCQSTALGDSTYNKMVALAYLQPLR